MTLLLSIHVVLNASGVNSFSHFHFTSVSINLHPISSLYNINRILPSKINYGGDIHTGQRHSKTCVNLSSNPSGRTHTCNICAFKMCRETVRTFGTRNYKYFIFYAYTIIDVAFFIYYSINIAKSAAIASNTVRAYDCLSLSYTTNGATGM